MIRRLGSGGMADIYLAEQSSLRRQVALKVLKPSLGADNAYVRRFHVEAQAAAALVHANIVQIHEVGCIDGLHFIAQEYVRGRNLKQVLQKDGALEAPLAANIMRQVATALHKAAERGITHRDIKPDNILLSTDGDVKVADFGLARVSGNGEALNLTHVGMTLGTPLYMSPEQVEGKPVDPRSDLYSFGVTAYQMLAGKPPFEGETALAVAVQHLKKDPPPLKKARPDLPAGLCRIVHKLMAKELPDRYQTPGELLRDLRALKIEGAETQWPELEEWKTVELLAMAETYAAATQQLSIVMKADAATVDARGGTWPIMVVLFAVLLAAAGFLGGVAAAWMNRPDPLLVIDEDEIPQVPRQETAQQQHSQAILMNTERAYMSVSEYFPPDESPLNQYYARLADQQLARMYLREEDWRRALARFDEFAALEPAEEEFRLFGIAGQAIVYAELGETDKSKQALAAVLPHVDKLDEEMQRRIADLENKYAPENGM